MMRRLRPFGHGFRGVVCAFARLDLDEHQRPAAARDDIDFAERGFPAPGHDPVALGDQQHGGAAFRGKPKPKRRDALGARGLFDRLRRLSAAGDGPGSFASASAR